MIKWKKTTDLDARSFFKSWQSYTVLVLAVGAMTFFGVCHPDQQGGLVLPTGQVARVDGTDIGSMEFRRAHIRMSNQMQQQYRENFDPVALGLSAQVVDSLVGELVLYKEATRNGLWAADAEIEKLILEGEYFKGEKGSFDPELLNRYLRSQGHTEASLTEELRRNIISNKLRNLVTSTYRSSNRLAEIDYLLNQTKLNVEFLRVDPNAVQVTIAAADVEKFLKEGGEEKVKEYFEKNKSEFEQEQKVKARHILIAYKEARTAAGEALKRTKDDAKALAGKVLGEVKANPNNFAKLAETYTDEPVGKSRGGDLGFFRKNQMAPEFANAAFALKPGEISDVVETPFGFHIIRVDAVQEAKSVSLDQARNEIAQKLLARDRKPEILAEKVKALLAAVKAGGGDAEMKDLNVSWKETGDFALGASVIPGGLGSDKSLRQAIAQLKKPGDFAADPLVVNGSSYVLRLKTRTDADLSKLDEKQRETMSESSRFMEAFGLYSALTSDIRKRYEDGKKIYKNSDFLNYDTKLRGPGAS